MKLLIRPLLIAFLLFVLMEGLLYVTFCFAAGAFDYHQWTATKREAFALLFFILALIIFFGGFGIDDVITARENAGKARK